MKMRIEHNLGVDFSVGSDQVIHGAALDITKLRERTMGYSRRVRMVLRWRSSGRRDRLTTRRNTPISPRWCGHVRINQLGRA